MAMAQTILSHVQPCYSNLAEWTPQEIRMRIEHNMEHRPLWKMLKNESDETKGQVMRSLWRYSLAWSAPEDVLKGWEDESDDKEEHGQGEGEGELDEQGMPIDDFGMPLDIPKIIELLTAAEDDYEKGLSLIWEVEKGSHMKPAGIARFRTEAIAVFSKLSQKKLDELDPHSDDDEDDDEDLEPDWSDENEYGDDLLEVLPDMGGLKLTYDKAGGEGEGGTDDERKPFPQNKEEILVYELAEQSQQQQKDLELIRSVYPALEKEFQSKLQLLVHQHKAQARAKPRKK